MKTLNCIDLYTAYLVSNFTQDEINAILEESKQFFPLDNIEIEDGPQLTYNEIQNRLSTINEVSPTRKKNGVYYTENDITNYIISNCFKLSCGIDIPELKISEYSNICKKTVFDPTCGSGAFLLTALELKLKAKQRDNVTVRNILKSIFGNDIDEDSVLITKLRLFLCILNFSGIKGIKGISEVLNSNFTSCDFFELKINKKFDLVVGNPPYVEEPKTDSKHEYHYGNIYANVLAKAVNYLSVDGVLGFIVPLSYSSTPRMSKIRNVLNSKLKNQIVLSYADRPGCLFTGVHQKLNIVLGTVNGNGELYSSNYQYWYKGERNKLFDNQKYILNKYQFEKFIPKLGNDNDISIFNKIINQSENIKLKKIGTEIIYLNMRACFWIKVFLTPHTTGEYKFFFFDSQSERNFIYCILNSSLFWWYWICISDGWHITSKEIDFFRVPKIYNDEIVFKLAFQLDNKLEETKKYIGSVQTQYEYKHKLCVPEIHQIDDYINNLYGLTEKESIYIKNFALPYRTSEGVAT